MDVLTGEQVGIGIEVQQRRWAESRVVGMHAIPRWAPTKLLFSKGSDNHYTASPSTLFVH